MFRITATAMKIRREGCLAFFAQTPSYFNLKVLSCPSGGDEGTIWRPYDGVQSTEGLSERN